MSAETYSSKQKEELSSLFAAQLFMSIREKHPSFMGKVVEKLLQELKKLPWFAYDGNPHGLLRHLEEAGVYGVYQFDFGYRSSIYLDTVCSQQFAQWVRTKNPSRDAFVRNYPKSSAHRPDEKKLKRAFSF